MAKTEFQSSEDLTLTFEPFINPATGLVIESGDTVSIVATAPDSSHPTPAATRDATTKIWSASILASSFLAGKWLFRATSSDGSAPNPQYRTIYWGAGAVQNAANIAAIKAKTDNLPAAPAATGDVTSAVTSIEGAIEGVGAHTLAEIYSRLGAPTGASIAADVATVQTRLGSPVGASLSADLAAVKADTASAVTKLGTPVGASLSADVAAVKAASDVAVTQATLARKAQTNRDKVQGTQLVLFDDDGTTPLRTWNLFDDGGVPTSTRIFERVPV